MCCQKKIYIVLHFTLGYAAHFLNSIFLTSSIRYPVTIYVYVNIETRIRLLVERGSHYIICRLRELQIDQLTYNTSVLNMTRSHLWDMRLRAIKIPRFGWKTFNTIMSTELHAMFYSCTFTWNMPFRSARWEVRVSCPPSSFHDEQSECQVCMVGVTAL